MHVTAGVSSHRNVYIYSRHMFHAASYHTVLKERQHTCCGFRGAGKFFWFGFIIFLTLNLMCFYGVMGVYITPDLIVGTVLSAFFYGFW